MYILNPVWATDVSWVSEEEDIQPDFSDEISAIAHRLSIMPFNESLYHFCKTNAVHPSLYAQDLTVKFLPSSVAVHSFNYNNETHWICSVGFGEGFDAKRVAATLKFLVKKNKLFGVSEWLKSDILTPYLKELGDVDAVDIIGLVELKLILDKGDVIDDKS